MQPKDLGVKLPPLARLLYREICSFYQKKGVSFATNNYFALKYGVSPRTVSRHLSLLEAKGLISMKTVPYQLHYHYREITPVVNPDQQYHGKNTGATDEDIEAIYKMLGRLPESISVIPSKKSKKIPVADKMGISETDCAKFFRKVVDAGLKK